MISILGDLYSEIKGFFCGSVIPYSYFVQEVYADTYALELWGDDDNEFDPIELVGAEDHALMDIRDRIREIIGGSDIFITDDTIWMMGERSNKKKNE